MKRKIIRIDQAACDGCGLCAAACHEGAIGIVKGKAVLLREDYCDGLGDCLPACPRNAIAFEEREAPAYDRAAAERSRRKILPSEKLPCGCPGSQVKARIKSRGAQTAPAGAESELSQWPVQLRLVPASAPFFRGAELLVAADCTAYAYASFHADFIRGRVTLIGCPKLDPESYREKLTAILSENDIRSVLVVRMEVPCCGGLAQAARQAAADCGKKIPLEVVTISTEGTVLGTIRE